MSLPTSSSTPQARVGATAPAPSAAGQSASCPACPACGGPLYDVRAKLQCRRCGQICETCCEGGRG